MSTPNMDDAEEDLLMSMVGLTITQVKPFGSADGAGGGVELTLSDGRTIRIEGWGHDYWGIDVEDVTNRVEPTPAPTSPPEDGVAPRWTTPEQLEAFVPHSVSLTTERFGWGSIDVSE